MAEKSLTSIALVIPYFGKLPDYFSVWKRSAQFNETIDFLMFTDVDELKSEGNIKVFHMSFAEFRGLIQKKFPFEITLNKPYKLCDYKPVYGYVLEEYLRNYTFWGHCDIDLIFGDIRKFITEEILGSYDKILEHGHFTLYRNSLTINTRFMETAGYEDYDYMKAFRSNDSLYFDECLGMALISRKLGMKTYLNENCFFDAIVGYKAFIHIGEDKRPAVFKYRNGLLYAITRCGGQLVEREIMYAHFQKRKMNYKKLNGASINNFYIVPNKAVGHIRRPRWSARGGRFYKFARKIEHIKIYFMRYKEGTYSSFREYRSQRASLGEDISDAKFLIKHWEEFAEKCN